MIPMEATAILGSLEGIGQLAKETFLKPAEAAAAARAASPATGTPMSSWAERTNASLGEAPPAVNPYARG